MESKRDLDREKMTACAAEVFRLVFLISAVVLINSGALLLEAGRLAFSH
jgi:hypothetical protein